MGNRAIAYLDGFNIYYGLKAKNWRKFYWYAPCRLIREVAGSRLDIVAVKYFTARVKDQPDKGVRQSAYLDAIRAYSDAEVIYGKYYRKPRECHGCGKQWVSYEEKMTDSAMACHMVSDAFLDAFDTAVVVSGDTDAIPQIKMVRKHFPNKRVEVWFPPSRKNDALEAACHDVESINGLHLERAQMPDTIPLEGGILVTRPSLWV